MPLDRAEGQIPLYRLVSAPETLAGKPYPRTRRHAGAVTLT
jgi:hypothetical protein